MHRTSTRWLALLGLVTAMALAGTGVASAAQEAGTFEYHVGDALIQSLGFPEGNQAMASSNGDRVLVVATGTFTTDGKSATGGGHFTHFFSGGGSATGTFQATRMISFQSYGNATPQGLPANLFGGKLVLAVVITPDANPSLHLPATLTVECELGNPPSGTVEGIRLNVYDVINFNKTIPESGANVYIKQ